MVHIMTQLSDTDKQPVILIVDDVPENIQLLGSILKKEGFRIAAALNAQQALTLVSNYQPDLIILDIMLPDMDGYTLCKRLKMTDGIHNVPVIFITAKNQQVDEIKGFECGAVDYITKPFNAAVVYARIKVHLKLKSAQEALKNYNKHLDQQVKMRTRDLAESEKRFMTLFELAPEAYCISDPNGIIRDGNKAFLKLFAFKNKALITGKQIFSDPVSSSDKPEAHIFSNTIRRLISKNRQQAVENPVCRDESTIRQPGGKRIDIEIKSMQVKIKEQDYILSLLRDITEQKIAEKKLRESQKKLRKENRMLGKMVGDRYKFGDIIGKSKVMQDVYQLIAKAAACDINVVIYGETGTGKELVAKAIHDRSTRKRKTFVPVNCGAIPENIIESEFFGHKKGAFTGADTDKKGFLDVAHQGTLFLDEVGEIGLNMQIKLLRAIDGGGHTPVGGCTPVMSDARIIAATHQNLPNLIKKGAIRSDFFFRIQVITIQLPPLRERKEDIPLLVEHFANGRTVPAHIVDDLLHHDWPGNIRELQNVINRYFALKKLDFPKLTPDIRMFVNGIHHDRSYDGISGTKDAGLKHILGRVEKQVISEALSQHRWHKGHVCAHLGIDRKTLNTKIHAYELDK